MTHLRVYRRLHGGSSESITCGAKAPPQKTRRAAGRGPGPGLWSSRCPYHVHELTNMRWLALTGLLLAGLPSLAQSQESFDTFSERACGVSFRHPRWWVVARTRDGVWTADYSGGELAC